MKKHLRNITQSPFWRNVFTLFSGNFLAQAFALALLPFITRIYPPEAFGIVGVFMATVHVIVVVSNGGYEWAIMLPKNDRESHKLVLLSIYVLIGVCLFITFPLGIWGSQLMQMVKTPELMGWHWLIPMSLLMEGIAQALKVALNRYKHYRILSASKVVRSMTQAIFSLGLGWYGLGFEGLLYAFLLAQIGRTLILLWGYWHWFLAQDFVFFLKDLKKTANNYKDFPRYSVISTWLNTASKHLPFFILPILFTQEINGQFSQADRVLTLPVVLISMAIGQVFFEQASKAKQESKKALAQITYQTFLKLLLLAIPFLLIVMILGPWMFETVLGEEWRLAGEYARWLIPWVAVAFITSPLAYLVDIQRKLKTYLLLNLLLFVARLVALLIGGFFLNDIQNMMLYGFVSMVVVGIQLLYLLRITVSRM